MPNIVATFPFILENILWQHLTQCLLTNKNSIGACFISVEMVRITNFLSLASQQWYSLLVMTTWLKDMKTFPILAICFANS